MLNCPNFESFNYIYIFESKLNTIIEYNNNPIVAYSFVF